MKKRFPDFDQMKYDELDKLHPLDNNDMENTELKPCPFCGGKALYGKYEEGTDYIYTYHRIECVKCGANIDHNYISENVIKKWNNRYEK